MIAPIQRVIVLDCSDQTLFQRLAAAKRDRFDDQDTGIIRKRIETFRTTTSRVVEMFEGQGKIVHVDGEKGINEVSEQMRIVVQDVLHPS